MPIQKTKSGGYRFGSSGKTYYGAGARDKARRQGAAIKISQSRRK